MYVKVMNKESGLPQVLTKKSWDRRNQNSPSQAEKLEYLHDCDEDGNKVGEEPTLQLMPSFEERINKASELLGENKLKDAKAEIEEALKINPNAEIAKNLLDTVEAEIQNELKLSEEKKQAEKLESFLEKAKVQVEKKKYQKAKEFVEHALTINSEHEAAKELLETINQLMKDGKKD